VSSQLCPYISTIQVLVDSVAFQARAQAGINLAGLKGAPAASAPGETNGQAIFVHKNPVPPDGFDPKKDKLDISQVKKFVGQPLSAPCNNGLGGMCKKWCAEHEQPKCGSGCDECQIEIMAKAFTSALAAQGESLGLAAARKLLDKAHKNLEDHEEEPA
jgi:hypothetical protein